VDTRKSAFISVHQRPINKLASLVALFVLAVAAIFFATPQGRAWAGSLLRFFERAENDTLPLPSDYPPIEVVPTRPSAPTQILGLQAATPAARSEPTQAPQTGTGIPDPASILDAGLKVKEVEDQAGFDLLEPAWLPEVLTFAGASFDPDAGIARIFYRYLEPFGLRENPDPIMTNGLVLREEPFQTTDDCELCGVVGASAAIETVQIGEVWGEYVEGVWKYTDDGLVWESDPYLKTMRWQSDGMAFELGYMGPPDTVTEDEMIAIADSME
jgi:hypothetical protein